MSKEEIINKLIEENIDVSVRYHSPLPGDVAQWYVYTRNSGHRILSVINKDLVENMSERDYEERLVSVPVKTVLRGYTIQSGFVVIDSDCIEGAGLPSEGEDMEFEQDAANQKSALSVGELYLQGRTSWPEAVEYNYYKGNHELRFLLKNPTRYVTEVIRKMPVHLGLYLQDNIILFVYKFTDYKKQLIPVHGYSPFSIHMVPDELRTLPEESGLIESGETLHIHLVDADTGILRAARKAELPPEFLSALYAAITGQSKTPLADDYNDRLLEIDSRYPDNESLLAHCSVRCAG